MIIQDLINCIGKIHIPKTILDHADRIKLENYKTNSPDKFQKYSQYSEQGKIVTTQLSQLFNVPEEKIDWVYSSVCGGAEHHVDQLDPKVFTDHTFVIPIVLPTGVSVITVSDTDDIRDVMYTTEVRVPVELNNVYHFDHTKVHSMHLEDTDNGCVVIMAAILKNEVH